jgi:hypothetical protein
LGIIEQFFSLRAMPLGLKKKIQTFTASVHFFADIAYAKMKFGTQIYHRISKSS